MLERKWTGPLLVGLVATNLFTLTGAPRADDGKPAASEGRAARRRWALARMDEMAGERLRCRERFTVRRQVDACEAEHVRRYREYNEIYLEASRE
jgi:hypothetical protein